jgi:hypothetical protein
LEKVQQVEQKGEPVLEFSSFGRRRATQAPASQQQQAPSPAPAPAMREYSTVRLRLDDDMLDEV